MTPEWIAYIEALLSTPQRPEVREVAQHVGGLTYPHEITAYLKRVMLHNAEVTRVYEVCWDIWALLTGVGEAA